MILRKIIIFRAFLDSEETIFKLKTRGFDVIHAPVVDFRAIPAIFPHILFDFVIAASAKVFLFAPSDILSAIKDKPLYVVGQKTAEAAWRAGYLPAVPPAQTISALIDHLPPGRALYVAGRDHRPELAAALGVRVTTLVVYEACAREAFDAQQVRDIATAGVALHYSPRHAALAAELVRRAGGATAFQRLLHICISYDTARALAPFGVTNALWAQEPTEEGLFRRLDNL